jgi:hypothetical protein
MHKREITDKVRSEHNDEKEEFGGTENQARGWVRESRMGGFCGNLSSKWVIAGLKT